MNIFGSILANKPKKNVFNLSHEVKMTANMGGLYPFYMEEVIPGDSFKVNSEIMMRLQPLVAPVMHRVDVFTHYFFVPNRIIWDEWEDFITGGEDGLASVIQPTVTLEDSSKNNFQSKSLSDYLGIPPMDVTVTYDSSIDISVLPFRAYTKIYNDYYRDQNLEDEIDTSLNANVVALRTRAWEKDYFTSALPFAQKGGAVTLPLQGEAPIITEYDSLSNSPTFIKTDGTIVGAQGALDNAADGSIQNLTNATANLAYDPQGTLKADLTQATSVTVEELRQSIRLQEWLERNARGGTRYIEQIYAHFGVMSSDARLQRPEYLGGGKQPVSISEVLSTVDLEPNPIGTMAGHGISVGKSNRFSKTFEEHGYILGIMSVMPRTNYQQGIHKTWSRQDKLDYYWPEFAQLGEQEIKNKELYVDYLATSTPDSTFGYQSRYAEYKYGVSRVAGDMRGNLDFWHFGRKFDVEPALNNEFIKCYPRKDAFAVTADSEDELIIQIFNRVKAIRPMPYFNVPTI